MNTRASTQAATDLLRSQVPAKIPRAVELASETLKDYLTLMVRDFIDDDIGIHENTEITEELTSNFQVFMEKSKPFLDQTTSELSGKLCSKFKIQ